MWKLVILLIIIIVCFILPPIIILNLKIFENMPVHFNKISHIDKDCQMPIKTFQNLVKQRCFTDYDGYGYYATETEESNQYVELSELVKGIYPEWATHVMWYNK